MRVVRNLTENNGRNLSDMVACLRLVNEQAESAIKYGWDVYEALWQEKRKGGRKSRGKKEAHLSCIGNGKRKWKRRQK